jgi:hypothetical protein
MFCKAVKKNFNKDQQGNTTFTERSLRQNSVTQQVTQKAPNKQLGEDTRAVKEGEGYVMSKFIRTKTD